MFKFTQRTFCSKLNTRSITMLLTGAPGVGKGTFGKRLTRDLGVPTFAMGDHLRQMLKDPTCTDPDIQRIREGQLVPNEKLIQIFKSVISVEESVILDGFPRTLPQAEFLDHYKEIDMVLNLFLEDDIIVAKLAGRRVCPTSGETYNIFEFKENGYDMDPLLPHKDPARCDKSGELLVQRDDDTPEVIKKRLEIYNQETAPLLDFYKERGKIVNFEPRKGVKDYPEVMQLVKQYLNLE